MKQNTLIKCNHCSRVYFLSSDKNENSVCKFMNHEESDFSLLSAEEEENIPVGITISGIFNEKILASISVDAPDKTHQAPEDTKIKKD